MSREEKLNQFLNSGYGLFAHWTSESMPKKGVKKAYQEAAHAFDVDGFTKQVKEAGAKYLFFTVSHIHMYLPFPCKTLDNIIEGRTCERDLILELYEKLAANGIDLMCYYNADGVKDEEWMKVSGFKTDVKKHAGITYELVRAISNRYGDKIKGWWIDGCYDKNFAEETGIRYDYKIYANALRAGNKDSLITFNFKGTSDWDSVTGVGIQDFQAGEENDLTRLPASRFSGECNTGWHALCWMDDFWVHDKTGTPKPRFSNEEVVEYIKNVIMKQGVFSYNVAPYQEGLISEATMDQLRYIRESLKNS